VTAFPLTHNESTRSPSWNNSTIVVQLICDRMQAKGWAAKHLRERPTYGPACQLEKRTAGSQERHCP
jgi:hypothetical protein